MFSYVFCDRMKLIQAGLYSSRERPSSTSKVVGQQTAKTVFKLFNVYSYIIFVVGGGGVEKNYQEIKRGTELIPLLRTVGGGGGGHDIIISPLKLNSQPRSWYILHTPSAYIYCRSRLTDHNACLTTIFHPVPIILCFHNQRLRPEEKALRHCESAHARKIRLYWARISRTFRPVQGNHNFKIRDIFASGIINPGLWDLLFSLGNRESTFHLQGIQNPVPGIQNQ